jgi:hypothetical protein
LFSPSVIFLPEDPFCYDDVNCDLVAQQGDQSFAVVNRIMEYCFIKKEKERLERNERMEFS